MPDKLSILRIRHGAALRREEHALLARALEATDWNLTRAALYLGLRTPSTLQSLLRQRHQELDRERLRRLKTKNATQ